MNSEVRIMYLATCYDKNWVTLVQSKKELLMQYWKLALKGTKMLRNWSS